MSQLQGFKNFNLLPGTPISNEFLALSIPTFLDAALYVRELPYGRNSNKSNRLLVLSEKCGTCSGKHALLAELAIEHQQPIQLYFGIFKISKITHPVVASILENSGLDYYPELHAYLVSDGARFDFTGIQNTIEPKVEFLKEFPAEPNQVESYKEKAHKEFLAEWLITEKLSDQLNLEQLWKVREECIATRSDS